MLSFKTKYICNGYQKTPPMSSMFFSTSVIPVNHFHNAPQAERNEKNYLLFKNSRDQFPRSSLATPMP